MSITFEKVLILKNIPMFENASEMALSDLISSAEEKTFKVGDVLLDNQKENTALFIVLAVLPYQIKAVESTCVLKISGHRLYQVMSLHPSIAKGFIGELSRRLR